MSSESSAGKVPGTIINHDPASSGKFNGCPSIVVMPDGGYVASHSHFGAGSTQRVSFVYRSADKGITWERIAELDGQIWSKLFLHQGRLYIIGTDQCDRVGDRMGGAIVVRRSEDGGKTWTEPTGSDAGLLTDEAGYHTAPVPVAIHGGRVWKACEYGAGHRRTWRTFVVSAPTDADLLERSNWTFSEQIDSWPSWQWIEGNAVVAPEGELVILSRANDMDNMSEWGSGKQKRTWGDETVAMIHVCENGLKLTHDPDRDRIRFPGGGTKFTVRLDGETSTYLALVNPQPDRDHWRNRLSLSISRDLREWHVVKSLLHHPDTDFHGFQYVDWDFDGDDIVFLSRTAHDDEFGGANNAHDANYTTYHRIGDFRQYLTI